MFGSYFSPVEQAVIAGSALATLAAVYLYQRRKDKGALGLLLLAALAMRVMVAQLDPFLNNWDECFHAVVAKHMAVQPFTPMLYSDTAMELGNNVWTLTHVWLHKQPFFLWMMALSIKLLGNTVLAVRLPSVLFTTALVFFTHGIARAMHGRGVAFMAAMLMAWSYWIMMLIIGMAGIDHNDAIFISLTGGAFWGWMQWRNSMSVGKAMLLGLFMGCAVLTKWLPGFLLMGGWAIVAITKREGRAQELRWMATAFVTGLAIAVPWQVYAYMRFPEVMAHEMALNAKHFTEVVEGHGGKADFYIKSISDQFHAFPNWLMFGALLLGIAQTRHRELRIMALVSVLLTYGFYSMAATKMSAFPMLVIPFFFMGLAHLIKWVALPLESPKTRNALMMVLVLAASAAMVDLERIQEWHTEQARRDAFIWWLRGDNLHNLEVSERVDRFIGPDHGTGTVVYNVPFPANMNMMYFQGHQATQFLPSAEIAESLLALGRRVVIVDPPEGLEDTMPSGVAYFRTASDGYRSPPH